jgi:hypothetical protein
MSEREDHATAPKRLQRANGKDDDQGVSARPDPTVTIIETWKLADDDA